MADKVVNTVWLVGTILALILIVGFAIVGNAVTKAEMDKALDAKLASLDVPSAQEIADLIVIPDAPEVVVPEFKSDEQVKDLWEDLYATEISDLEDNAECVATDELEDDDFEVLEDYLKANIEGFDELKDVDYEDVDVKVLELGLEEDEDKIAEVVFELKVKYNLEEGQSTTYKKVVFVTANVVFEEGDFDEEQVDLTFAFK